MEMFANLECPYNKSKHFTLTYDDIRPPQCHAQSSLSTPSSKKQGHEPLRAVSGMSHITTPFKKSPPCPSRLCPEQLYCHPTHRKQR